MDTGKKKALNEVRWSPAKSCGTCHFGQFNPGSDWGLCGQKKNEYHHNKHDRTHQLPAHKQATCDEWAYTTFGVAGELKTFLASPVTS